MRLLILFSLLPFFGRAQYCGSDLLLQEALQQSTYQLKHQGLELAAYRYFRENPAAPEAVLQFVTLPVVVHIVHDNGQENIPDARVMAGIQYLNEAFANQGYYDQSTGVTTMIQFCLARRTPDNQATNGITRIQNALTDMTMESQDIALKDLNRWAPTQYINIWLVREICSAGSGCGVAGYAFFPASHGDTEDGIVMEARWMGSTPGNSGVLVHEMGHYLGLYHTFQGGCQNDDCLTDGDRVCDTPPDQSTVWVPCNQVVNSCTTDAQSGLPADVPDMIQNFMDYTDFDCFHDFTAGQNDRMHWHIDNVRNSLLDSKGCQDPCPNPVTAFFTPSTLLTTPGATVNFTNGSSNAVAWEWSVEGTSFSTAANPGYTFPNDGFYTITLRAISGNTALCADDTYSVTIQVQCPVVADFSVSNLYPAVGETVTVTNQSQNASQFSWLLNGVPQAPGFTGFTPQLPGVYALRLNAGNGACTQTHIIYLSVRDGSADCANTWLRLAGIPGIDEGGTNIITASDGHLYGSGYRGDSTLLFKCTPDGNLLWVRTFKMTPNPSERVTCLIEDSEGMLAGTGISGSPAAAGYFFRYDPNSDQIKWVRLCPSVTITYVYVLLEKTPGGNYLSFVSYLNSPAPGSDDDANWVEIDRNTGQLTVQGNAWSFGSSESVLEARIRNGNLFTCGRYTYGSVYWGMRCGLSRFDLQGNQLWARTTMFGSQGSARVYATNFCFDGDTMVTISYGDFLGSDPATNQFAVCKTDLDGTMAWTRIYTITGSKQLITKSIVLVPDGYCILLADLMDPKTYLVKVDKDGLPVWTARYDDVYLFRGEKLLVLEGDYLYFTAAKQGDIVLAKVNTADGQVSDDCPQPVPVILQQLIPPISDPISMVVYPSPMTLATSNAAPQPRVLPEQTICEGACMTEICTNGIDDDGDGLVDCLDDDCDCTPCDGQQARFWYFGDGAGLYFATNPPAVQINGQTFSREASAVAADIFGNLLFYTDGQTIYNRIHQAMSNGSGLNGHPSTTQTLILPQPGLPWRFYVLTPNSFDNLGSGSGLTYSVVDMSLQGGFGNVLPAEKNLPLLMQSLFTEKISATRHCNGEDWWIVTKERGNNQFRSWRLSAAGLSPPVISAAGTPATAAEPNVIGCLKFSPDGKKLANTLFQTGGLDLLDFDNSTGIVSNAITLANTAYFGAYGVEFSPNGRLLYLSCVGAPSDIWQFDLDALPAGWNPVLLAQSPNEYRFGQLQRAPNNKIYVPNTLPLQFTPGLGIIHQPNNPGTACQYQQNGISLSPGGANLGLPSFPQDFFPRDLQPQIMGPDSICGAGTSALYRLDIDCGIDTVIWTLTGPATPGQQSTDSFGLVFNQSGTVELVATVFTACAIATDTLRIQVFDAAPVLNLGPDRLLCDNGVMVLQAGPGYQRYRWNDGSTDATFTTLFPGNYWLEVWDACGNRQSDTVNISIIPATVLDLGPDRSACPGSMLPFDRPAGFAGWSWLPPSGVDCADCPTVTATVGDTAVYIVTAYTSENCFSTDTIMLLPASGTLELSMDTVICSGSVLELFGLSFPADTTVQIVLGNVGCDTLLTIRVLGVDPVFTSENLQKCPGDTLLINGITVAADTTLAFRYPATAGCDSTHFVTISSYPALSIFLPATDTLVIGDTLRLQPQTSGGTPPFQWIWTPPDGLSCFDCPDPLARPLADVVFNVQATDANGCIATAAISVLVMPCAEPYIPNAFTPNDDGVNDRFYIFGPECLFLIRSLRVYSRWGELVFERRNFQPNQSDLGWDGRYRDQDFPAGVLLYIAEIEMPDGKVLVRTGDVTLIR